MYWYLLNETVKAKMKCGILLNFIKTAMFAKMKKQTSSGILTEVHLNLEIRICNRLGMYNEPFQANCLIPDGRFHQFKKFFFNLHWMMKNIRLFNVCEAQSIFKKYWTLFVKEKPTEPWHENSNDVVCATSKASDQPVHMRSLIRAFASRLNILWLSIYWLNILCSFYALKGATQIRLSLYLSKCHIVGNHMSRLNLL